MSKYKFILINDEDGTETDLSREFIPEEDEPNDERVSFFHSMSSVGISSRKREPGLYFGVPKVNR